MWKKTVAATAMLFMFLGATQWTACNVSAAPLAGGTLDPTTITKYVTPLLIPPAMPPTEVENEMEDEPNVGTVDYYEIAVRQFQQQILPAGMPKTTVWGYGSINHPGTFHYPSYTIEANVNRPVRVKWINDLKNPDGTFLPHLLPIDQTLHWANPPQDCIDSMMKTDCRGQSPQKYQGPVPIVVHLHGAHVDADSDGYPEAWWLPAATNIPAGYAPRGSRYSQISGAPDEAGTALYQYRNDQRAATLWFHDHSLGMTRTNVYAGPVGFYLLRGGSSDLENGLLPGPAPSRGDRPGIKYREIPLAIQDRSFNTNGSLFYPDNRAFFEGLNFPTHPDPQLPGAGQLQIPFIPQQTMGGQRSDVSPIWNPEFFGNTMVVNGATWPVMEVENGRYRFRLLNGSDTRFLMLKMAADPLANRPSAPALPFWQVGSEGGFLPAPVQLDSLLIAPAERADVIVDFSGLAAGTEIYLINEGPDEPFGGGAPFTGCLTDPNSPAGCFEPADAGTTGQVMKFKVVAGQSVDTSLPPASLALPALTNLPPTPKVRRLSLNEDSSQTVFVNFDLAGNLVEDPAGAAFGPTSARLGILDGFGLPVPKAWMDALTENPERNAVEIWEIYNFTADAHPIHVHQTMFQVVDRQALQTDADGVSTPPATPVGTPAPPEVWETGFKDTVIAYPGQVTRIKVFFDLPGLYVWHCHILSHEDNEMMRPICVGRPGIDCPADLFPSVRRSKNDFDGDGKADVAVWRSAEGNWYTIRSSDGTVTTTQWGTGTLFANPDVPVAGDYDGDGKTDIAVWRPADGNWYVIRSSDGVATTTQWGTGTLFANPDVPVPGDYDGDGKTDIAVWRPSEGNWHIIRSSDGAATATQWGTGTLFANPDVPVAGDYDGDGKTDIAVWRPSEGNWYIIRSSDGVVTTTQWGTGTLFANPDVPVPGDYDGDGKTDIAVWRPSEGNWYIIRSSDGVVTTTQWGTGTLFANPDVPVPGDYDGDGKTDMAVWRPAEGNWYIIPSGSGLPVQFQWGGDPTDVPIGKLIR